ncbi:hypothetical protein F5H01DRAFT_284071 [Linnemannia elongata]|nr:hypothetical protein F5H01DRAFT_284071 [Linnemannia elongata]
MSALDGPAIVCQSPLDAPEGASHTRPLSTHLSQHDREASEESVPEFEDEAARKASILAVETAKRLFEEDETLMKREEIAAYMATPNAFYRSILVHYMSYFDFSGLRLDMAFRALCQKLVLKGESQEVDRVLEAFAGRYVTCNPRTLLGGADHAKDVVHAITYSILLLNTDLHIVQQSSKMSKSAFIKNTLHVVQQSDHDRSEDISSSSSQSVMSVDPVGLGLPRSLTAETSLEPISPTGSKRRTPSVKSWKSGNSQQSTGLVGSSISTNTQPYNSKLGTDPRANSGHGNGKVWQHELETLLKDIYTAVKQNQILLPTASAPPVFATRAGSRSNTISSPPTSPVVSGFGSSFLSNRMSRLINPSSFSQSQFSSSSRLSTLTLNTSMSESTNTTTPSASQNSLASLQSLGPRASVHPDDSSNKPGEGGSEDFMLQDDDSVSIQEQKDLWHQHHLQTRYRMEGILWRKHLLERADKKAQHRAWRQLLVVLDLERGTLSMFRSDGLLPSISAQPQSNSASLAPPFNDSDASVPLFDDIPLQHTITNILPPPGYSASRRHVFALQLFTGAVYLFQTKTPQECESWARTCNYWASRTSKEPLIGGVVNMEYGWGRALDGVIMALQAEESASTTSSGIDMVESPRPMQSSVNAHMGSSMPAGDRITLFEWTEPMPTMSQSLLTEEEQMQALKRYVASLESEMEVHQEHRVPMMRLFHPKSSNYAKAFNNWERRSRHLLKEMVKYQIYVECLEQSIHYQLLFLQQQRQRMNQFESPNPNHHPQQQQHQHRLDELQRQSEEQSMLEAVELAGNGGSGRRHSNKNVDVEAELEALIVREGPPRSWNHDGPLST